jgi:DNA end-binding protein Ku
LETPYYLSVEDPVGQEAFSVIRDAMAAQKMVGISRLVISRRERAVMLEPRGKGIVLWTLHYGGEFRDEDAYFENIDDDTADAEMMPLVQQLIKQQTRHWDSKMVEDPVQDRLLEIIALKKNALKKPAKSQPTAPEPVATKGNVVNSMDALRKSIQAEARSGKST